MKERPIIFNSDEVRAILDGRKTMMRKPVKNKELLSYLDLNKTEGRVTVISCEDFAHDISEICPYGGPGDRLWVKETWRLPYGAPNRWVDYKADDARDGFKWRSPVHMPRWASRIMLEIVSIRVERLTRGSPPEWVWVIEFKRFGRRRTTSLSRCRRGGGKGMSCHICGRGSCAPWMHSLEEQERYAPAIELFEKAEELREKIRNEEAEEADHA